MDWTGLQANQQNAMNRNPIKRTEPDPGEKEMARATVRLSATKGPQQ